MDGSSVPVIYDNSNIGSLPEYMLVDTDLLDVHPAYQREINTRRSQANIKYIVEKFEFLSFEALAITPNENSPGRFYMINGQHRGTSAKIRGIKRVPALCYHNLTVEQQARMFLNINMKKVSVNNFAIFHARLAANEPLAVGTKQLADEARIIIPRYPIPLTSLKPGQTMAVGALEKVVKEERNLDRKAVIMLGNTYHDKINGVNATLIRAAIAAVRSAPSAIERIGDWFKRQPPHELNSVYRDSGGSALLADRIIRELRVEAKQATSLTVQSGIATPTRQQLMGRR